LKEDRSLYDRLSEHLLNHINGCAKCEDKVPADLIHQAHGLGRSYKPFLQEFWGLYEKSAKECLRFNWSPGNDRKLRRYRNLRDAFSETLDGLEASEITVNFFEGHRVLPFLRELERKGKIKSICFQLAAGTHDLSYLQLCRTQLTKAIDYHSSRTNMFEHKIVLGILPFLRSVRMKVDSSSKAHEFTETLSKLTFVECFELEVLGEVKEGLLEAFFNNLKRWPITELSLTSSAEHAEKTPVWVANALPHLKHLKKLSLNGIAFPNLLGRSCLEELQMRNIPNQAIDLVEAETILQKTAPNLRRFIIAEA
jgi:hypothetical protein